MTAAAQTGSAAHAAPKTVLNVGSGPWAPHKLHPFFRTVGWNEVRVDIDPAARPDVVADAADLSAFRDASVDAVWSSHNLEHLHDHEVPLALREFLRVLRSDGLLLLTMPDLQSVAEMIAAGRCEDVAYVSPAGPITPIDMVFGHRPSIAAGNAYMAHRTGFTQARLRRMLVDTGFRRNHVFRGRNLDLWGIALMPGADPGVVEALFHAPADVP